MGPRHAAGRPERSASARASAPADRRAYDRTLWGENKGASFTEAIENGHFDRLGGCTLTATERVFGGAQVLTQLQGKLDVLDERILEDQRMVRAIESWASCMADAGFRYEDPEEIDADLFTRMEKLVGPLPGQFATGPPAGEKAQSYDPRRCASCSARRSRSRAPTWRARRSASSRSRRWSARSTRPSSGARTGP